MISAAKSSQKRPNGAAKRDDYVQGPVISGASLRDGCEEATGKVGFATLRDPRIALAMTLSVSLRA